MNNKVYAYTLNSRVVWWDEKLQQIPVIADMYMVHRVERPFNVPVSECTAYVIRNNHKFEDELIYSPLLEEESPRGKMLHLKVNFYMKLVDYINCSYNSAFPAVLGTEADRLEILAGTMIDVKMLNAEALETHCRFVATLISDKKNELKARHLRFVTELKEADTVEEVQRVGYTIVYEGINVV